MARPSTSSSAQTGTNPLFDLVDSIASDPAIGQLAAFVDRAAGRGGTGSGDRTTGNARTHRFVAARGSHGSSASFVAAALARRTQRPVVLVVAHLDEADECASELDAHGVSVDLFPALETLPGESGVSMDLLAARLGLVRRAIEHQRHGRQSAHGATPDATHSFPSVLVCPIQALMQPVPPASALDAMVRVIARGERCDPGALSRWLEQAGYERVDSIEEPGEYSVRGGIMDIFPSSPPVTTASASVSGAGLGAGAASAAGAPVRLDFFGDEIERLNEIDLDSMASDRALDRVELVCASIEHAMVSVDPMSAWDGASGDAAGGKRRAPSTAHPAPRRAAASVLDILPSDAAVILHETFEVLEQARGYYERLIDGSSGVFGPPAVLKHLQDRFACFIELNQFSPGTASSTDARVDLPVAPLPPLPDDAGDAIRQLAGGDTAAERTGASSVIFAGNAGELSRLRELLEQHAGASAAEGASSHVDAALAYVHRGFVWGGSGTDSGSVHVVPYHELLHRFEARRSGLRARRAGGPAQAAGDGSTETAPGGGAGDDASGTGPRAPDRLRAARAIDSFLDFGVGDYVVHREHGIGIFRGLTVMQTRKVKAATPVTLPGEKIDKTARRRAEARAARERDASADGTRLGEEECLTIEFAARAQIHVPSSKIDQVQKYVGGLGRGGKAAPTLSTLGGTRWKKQKQDVAESVKDLAGELLRIRAAREHLPGTRFPADTKWQSEFEAEFPFDETPDQLAAVGEIKRDMQTERPMDRLLCGDVGFGKTELAIRAAFKAVEFGKQVAVLVPTTVLAEQHERTFRSRFADYPFRVESISRFKTTQEVNAVLADLRKGQVDVIIGTHRLLSKDVKFADLGLVVIDEEQRFGVEHKERLLALRMTVDVLTLSATPIPRTLHLSMLGLRDISSLTTAPVDRRAVVTEVIPYNPRRIQQAIARELSRGGQCYFVHNRVYDIQSVADDIQKLAPDAKIVVGHGQMPDGELEEVMLRFMGTGRSKSGKPVDRADILVSTTIIESGIDVPTANTMFINNAERFGLADLHQLRGRVGRSKHRAYCYMLLDPEKTVADKAVKRLKAIEEFSMLGAGFKIAMRDLEIRGAGNILGPEQSGNIAAVGYEMYCQLLDRAVKELKNERTEVASETTIEIGATGLIPKTYIPSDQRRMEAYRRLAVAQSAAELARVETELKQAYGAYPTGGGVDRLLQIAALRVACSELGVRSVGVREKDVLMRVKPETAQDVANRLAVAGGKPGASATASVTVLPPSKTDADQSHFEVYYRPPESYLQDAMSLLAVLRGRLALPAAGAVVGTGR